uniref:Uncharacterized protein n=1 Tax=Rhizophora mucronata TaxID=61149 RepID=A0A2P2QXA7_RHIMU
MPRHCPKPAFIRPPPPPPPAETIAAVDIDEFAGDVLFIPASLLLSLEKMGKLVFPKVGSFEFSLRAPC